MSKRGFELLYDGGWQQVNGYEQEGWKAKTGPSDLTGMEPNSLDVTLANDDLSMDPSNPRSALYGKIGPNTPARMLMYDTAPITISDTFTRTTASTWGSTTTGQAWTTAGGSASDYSVSAGVGRMSLGSINASRRATLAGAVSSGEISVRITIPVDPTGDDIETTIMFNYQDGSNYNQASIYWDRDGRPIELRFVRRLAGVATDLAIGHLTVSPVGAGLTCDMRLRWFNEHMSLKAWPSALPEPATWNLAARDNQWASGQIGLRGNLQPLFAGGVPQVITWDNFTYSAYSASVIATGEASSWRPETSSEHVPGLRGRSWTGLTADDLLRRIGKWKDSTVSPLRRQITSYNTTLLGYWPLEEGADAKNFSNLAASRNLGYFTAALTQLGANDGPAGAFGAPVISNGAVWSGRFDFDTSVDGYQICFSVKLDALPPSATYRAMFQWSDTMQRTWYWRVSNAGFEVEVSEPITGLSDTATASFGADTDPTKWTRYRIKVSVSGSTVTYEPAWYTQDAINTYGMTGTFVNVSVGYPVGWQIVANAETDKAAYSHIFGLADLDLDLINYYDAKAAFDAYNGESTLLRYARLCSENGILRTWRGDGALAAIMGRQPRASLSELLQEIARTEGGIIFGDPTRLRLIFRLNSNLLNQTPILALTKGGNLGYPLKKVIDDQRAINDITVKNWDSTQVRVAKTEGARSTQDPPNGVGAYPGDLDVNFRYSQSLEQRGSWELANNTLDRPRYPTVTVDLLAFPALLPAVNAAIPGDILTIAGEEPGLIYLIIIQIERTGNDVRDTVVFTCQPADVFMSGEYDDGASRYDARTTTLSADVSSSATSIPIFSADPMDKWSTTPGYTIKVGPEVMTVTACTAGSASGTGWAQTMTVTRGTNTITLAHLSGESVHVGTPAYYVMKNREPL